MCNLSQTRPAVKAPVTAAEWAAYAAARNARQYVPPTFAPGDRVLYRTPRHSSGGGRNIRGTVVKVNVKTVTIRYALVNRQTQEIVGYERRAVNPMMLAKVIEPEAVQWNSDVQMGVINCPVCKAPFSNHADLARHIWNAHGIGNAPESVEEAAVADIQMSDWICSQCGADCGSRIGYIMHVATCNGKGTPDEEMPWETFLEELEAKPGLWFDEPVDEPDELDFMAATLDSLRMSGTGGNPQGRNDPNYDAWVAEGSPRRGPGSAPAFYAVDGNLSREPGYYESRQPFNW